VLVLDDVHLLHNRACLDVVTGLIDYLPPGSQLAIAGRGEPPLPLARLRAEGRLVEVGPEDLAMDCAEAGSLLAQGDVDVARVDVAEVVRRTEGWPVALRFAALSLGADGRRAAPAAPLAGDDRFLVDYVQFELLSRVPRRLVSFLTRCSVLERLSGPLCDAVLATTGSADLLESLSRSNLLVTPLDRRGQWYRLHRLFRELLRGQLERREPALAVELARRAAEWCEGNGSPEAAVEYAIAAGDADRAARVVVDLALPPTGPCRRGSSSAGSAGSRPTGWSIGTRAWPSSGPGSTWSLGGRPPPSVGPTPPSGRRPTATARPTGRWRCSGRRCAGRG